MKPLILSAIIMIHLISCTKDPHASHFTKKNVAQQKNIDVRVRVSNQSFAISPVQITIQIDKKTIINKSFPVGNQHLYKSFPIALSPGKHHISITSKNGQAELKKEFLVTKTQRWVDISYIYYPKTHYSPTPRQFSFQIVNEDRLTE